jgi:hypothetical protein
MTSTRVFIHGLESTSRGTKDVFFRERYPDMIIEDYVGSFAQRMERLEGLVEDDHFLHDTFATLEWDNLLSLQELSTENGAGARELIDPAGLNEKVKS